MSKEKWYLGRVSRSRAEELVSASRIDGSFVVRASESIEGAYALSVWYNGAIHTYRILPTENSLLAVQTIRGVQQRKFVSLTELITEYKNGQNGLVCGLTNPVSGGLDVVPSPPPPNVSAITLPNSSQNTLTAQNSTSAILGGVRVLPALDVSPSPPPIREAPTPSQYNRSQHVKLDKKLSNNHNDDLTLKFKQRCNKLKDVWPHDQSFMQTVENYVNTGLHTDVSSALQGTGQCVELKKLLTKEAGQLENELKLFLDKIKLLRQLVEIDADVTSIENYNSSPQEVDLDTLLSRLGDCGTLVKALNKRACNQLQVAAGGKPKLCSPKKVARNNSILSEEIFEVKTDTGLKTVRHKLKVDVYGGRLIIMKIDGQQQQEFKHNEIAQIIKNNKTQNKITLILNDGKKRDYIFMKRSTQREAFCQLMQHMINLKSNQADPDSISLFTGTWNMGDAVPPPSIASWFQCKGSGKPLDDTIQNIPHDVYVIGTQETGMPQNDWCQRVIETIYEVTGQKMHQVILVALWHIKIVVLVKEEHKRRISHVKSSSVKTGIANTLGNKGAVAVSMQFGGTPMCFINAHLTSGKEKCHRRNQNYHDIMKQLSLGNEQFSMFDLANRFEHLFFIGDLNYRLQMDNFTHIKERIDGNRLGELYQVDQLRIEKELNKVFSNFEEEEILFPPTYRYERGTRNEYSYIKVKRTGVRYNVPSWCDRVLWKSYPDTHIVCTAYGCTDDIMTSDHSPVYATFNVGVRGQFVSTEGVRRDTNKDASITFDYINIKLKNPQKNGKYSLEFRSTCLTEPAKSEMIPYEQKSGDNNYGSLYWDKSAFKTLEPIIGDSEFLVDQHLMLAVKCEDDIFISECVLALRSMIGTEPQNFERHLTRKGEPSGCIQGRMHVVPSGRSRKAREKTYEFIQIERDVRREPTTAIYAPIDEMESTAVPKLNDIPLTPSIATYSDIPQVNALPPLIDRAMSVPSPVSKKLTSSNSSPSSTSSRDLDTPQPLPRRNKNDLTSSSTLDAVFKEFNENAEAIFQMPTDEAPSPHRTPFPPSATAPTTAPTIYQHSQPEFHLQTSVQGFLKSIGLSKYSNNFLSNGWDSYEFLSDLTEDDLKDCGITDIKESKIIMNAIAKMQ